MVAVSVAMRWQMGNMEVEEVIERHVATLLMQDQAWRAQFGSSKV